MEVEEGTRTVTIPRTGNRNKTKTATNKTTPERKVRKTLVEPDKNAVAELHKIVVMVAGMASMIIPDELKPRPQDIDHIFFPAERIWLRHHPEVPSMSPDIQDAVALAIGIYGYGLHVLSNRTTKPTGPTTPMSDPTPLRQKQTATSSKNPSDIDPVASAMPEGQLQELWEKTYIPDENASNG